MLWPLWTQSDFASFQTHESLRLESKLRRRLSDFGVEEIILIGARLHPSNTLLILPNCVNLRFRSKRNEMIEHALQTIEVDRFWQKNVTATRQSTSSRFLRVRRPY